MKTLLSLLIAISALNVFSQSGRRVSSPPTTQPPAPIQPSLTAEPAPRPAPPPALLFLPESLREREIKALDNSTFRLEDFHGKIVVINIWASWCGPCRREIPEYEKVRKSYQGRDVEFIGLTTEDPRTSADKVNRFLRDTPFGFRLGWADRELARTLMEGRGAIPQTLVIDGYGRVINHWAGYSSGQSGSRLKQTIDRAIKGGD
jgi:thiol-disulfide isomerase/thioredoxin